MRAVVLAAAACLTTAASAIDGGAPARAGDRLARATVGIGTLRDEGDGLGVSRCSGVLIGPDVVLTAAHCVVQGAVSSSVVFYEGSRAVPPLFRVGSAARFSIPDDVPNEFSAALQQLSLDTAILRLERPVRGRSSLGVAEPGSAPPRRLRLAGTGLSRQGGGVLRTVGLTALLVTRSGLIVARADGARVCSGDSGGPVVVDGPRGPVIWGVASAVLTSRPPCGGLVVVAPAAPIATRLYGG